MKDTMTPPLSDGSGSSSNNSPLEPTPTSQLPNYTDATGSAAAPSDQVDKIALTLKNASLKLCDGPGLTPEERKEVDKALTKGVKIGLASPDMKLYDGHIDAPGIDAPPPPYAPTADPPPPVDAKSRNKPTLQEAEQAAAELSQQLQRERRWNIFLNRAAYRMELWSSRILCSDAVNDYVQDVVMAKEKASVQRALDMSNIDAVAAEKMLDEALDKTLNNAHELPDFALPPIDVALVLHSYHLNPLCKEEDSQRLRTRKYLSFFDYPLHQLVRRAHPDLPILHNVDLAKDLWEQRVTSTRTKQPWNLSLQPPPEHPTHAQETNGGDIFGLRLKCPRCHKTQFVPWTGQGKDPLKLGIGELGWERVCSPVETSDDCTQLISADHLQFGRFLQDYKQWRRSPGKKHKGEKPFFMAGTMIGAAQYQRSSRDYFGEALLTPVFQHEKPVEATAYKDHRVAKGATLHDIEQVGVQCNYNMRTFRG
ncbi:hypothetical protein NDA16_001692 [Ustilago loliicola]|nr:hypothetical protein NDA16_001692 [Ustilago loliicola]